MVSNFKGDFALKLKSLHGCMGAAAALSVGESCNLTEDKTRPLFSGALTFNRNKEQDYRQRHCARARIQVNRYGQQTQFSRGLYVH
jgi:hypothetical protein